MCRRVLRLHRLRNLCIPLSGRNLPSDGRRAGKTSERKAEHLKNRVEEIHEGKFDDLIEQVMGKPIDEIQELYNNREIEK